MFSILTHDRLGKHISICGAEVRLSARWSHASFVFLPAFHLIRLALASHLAAPLVVLAITTALDTMAGPAMSAFMEMSAAVMDRSCSAPLSV